MKRFLFLIALLMTASPARAQEAPVEISAATSLEWNRAAKTYTAKGDAVAKQGALEVRSNTLTADYRDDNGSTDIWRLTAADNVTIKSAPYVARGDKAVYNTAAGSAVLTGRDLKITTATEVLTASDNISFSTTENRLTATGNAVAMRNGDVLKADVLTAYFSKGADGKLTMQKMTANGHVSIKTARENVTGADNGVYDVAGQKAVLTGQIVIEQGAGRLEGTRADVDLKTGISQLFAEGSAATQGRVKGVFYPKPKAKP